MRRFGLIAMMTTIPLAACATAPAGFDARDWLAEHRPMGAGVVDPAHVRVGPDAVRLIADGPTLAGATLRTRTRYTGGEFRASLRCAAPRGALCALFLYQPDAGDRADEIDIELIGGTREAWLTTWVAGRRTNHVALELPFDPADGFHVYGIVWREGSVELTADGAPLARFEDGVPARPMALYANAWWPAWLAPSDARGALEIEWVELPDTGQDERVSHDVLRSVAGPPLRPPLTYTVVARAER